MQWALVALTIGGVALTAHKLPEYGMLANLASQPLWLVSSYQGWKRADQIGPFIISIVLMGVVTYGFLNYWVL